MTRLREYWTVLQNRIDFIFRYFDWVVLAVLVLIILIPKFPLLEVNGTYVHIRVEDFLVAIVYIVWLFGVYQKRFSLENIYKARTIVAFLGYGLLITLLGMTIFQTVQSPLLGILHWLRRVEYMSLYFVVASVVMKHRLNQYLHILFVTGIIAVFYAILQYYDFVPGVFTLSRPGEVVKYSQFQFLISTFGAHYDFGAFLSIMTLLSGWGYLATKGRAKVYYFLLGVVFVSTLTVVYARSAYLGLLSGLFVLCIFGRSWLAVIPVLEFVRTFLRYFSGTFNRFEYQFQFRILQPPPMATPTAIPTFAPTAVPVVTVTPVPVVSPVVTSIPSVMQTVSEPISTSSLGISLTPTTVSSNVSLLDGLVTTWSEKLNLWLNRLQLNLDTSASYRLDAWRNAFINVNYHYLWGGGYSTNGNSTDNDYLRHMAEVGVFGLAWFLLILWDFVRQSWRRFKETTMNLRERYYYLFMISVIGALMTQALFIDIFASSKIAFLFWFLMGNLAVLFKTDGAQDKI